MPSLCRDCFITHDEQLEKCPNCHSYRIVYHSLLDKYNIAHIDCDAFYAAIHKRNDKSLAFKPVIVGGGKRGVVSTACYIARASGVRSAMPMFKALKLCPNAIVIKPQMGLYSIEAKKIRKLIEELTPKYEIVSIDEAYLDLSGTLRLHGACAAAIMAKLAKRIDKELGLQVSIGISDSKFLAKLASDMDKPNGFFILGQCDVEKILWPKDIGCLHGVGPASVAKLNKIGIYKVYDLAKADKKFITKHLGVWGYRLIELANGIDNSIVDNSAKRKSISTETTFAHDIKDYETLLGELEKLTHQVGKDARRKKLAGRTLSLKLKTSNFKSITRQISLSEPTQSGKNMFNAIKPLLRPEIYLAPFRLIGFGLSELSEEANADCGDLINTRAPKNLALEKAMDKIESKFGKMF